MLSKGLRAQPPQRIRAHPSQAAIMRVMLLREQLRPYVMEQYEAASASGL